MQSRVHPTYKTRYRVGNWRAYESALVSRGDVTLWKKASGYHQRARVENAFFRYKSIIEEGLRAHPGGRDVEASLACRVLNRMTALGRPESSAINR